MAAGAGHGRSCDVDSVPQAAWNRAIGAFHDIHHEQTSAVGTVRQNSTPSTLPLSESGIVVAGARVVIVTPPGFKSGLAFLRYGPLWRRCDRDADLDIYRAIVAALVEEYCERRGHCLTIVPRPHPEFYERECEVLADHGFAVRAGPPILIVI